MIYPPVDTHLFEISRDKEDYYITCSRFVPYKRLDLIISAFTKMPDRKLVIIGSGSELSKLKAKAGKNIEFMGQQPHSVLGQKLSRAKAFVFAAEEDFGIVTVEAQAAGVPVIAYGKGGSLETVLPAQTGIFFKEQTPESLIEAIHRFEKMEADFEPARIKAHAEKFSKKRFTAEIKSFINEKLVP